MKIVFIVLNVMVLNSLFVKKVFEWEKYLKGLKIFFVE